MTFLMMFIQALRVWILQEDQILSAGRSTLADFARGNTILSCAFDLLAAALPRSDSSVRFAAYPGSAAVLRSGRSDHPYGGLPDKRLLAGIPARRGAPLPEHPAPDAADARHGFLRGAGNLAVVCASSGDQSCRCPSAARRVGHVGRSEARVGDRAIPLRRDRRHARFGHVGRSRSPRRGISGKAACQARDLLGPGARAAGARLRGGSDPVRARSQMRGGSQTPGSSRPNLFGMLRIPTK